MNDEFENFRKVMHETYVKMGYREIADMVYGDDIDRALQTHKDYVNHAETCGNGSQPVLKTGAPSGVESSNLSVSAKNGK